MGKHIEIEHSAFIIARPELQTKLFAEISEGEIPICYINRYHAEDEVSCAFCRQHQAHNRGFTALMEDGRIALCGRNFGIKVTREVAAAKFEQELDQQIRRESKRRIIRRTLSGIPTVSVLLNDELLEMENEALEACCALREGFKVSGILSKTSEQGHFDLQETRRRWIDQIDKEGRTRSVPIDEETQILRIRAAKVLNAGEQPKLHFEKARWLLEQLAAKNADEDLSDIVVERMAGYRSAAISAIQEGVHFLDLCSQFFERENVRALTELTRYVQASISNIALHKRSDGFELVFEENAYHKRVFYPVPDFTLRPSIDDLVSPLKEIN